MYYRLIICILCLPTLLPAQISMNMNLLDRWDDNTLPLRYGAAFNDIWGYVDPAGNEYALVGTIEGVYVFDVTNTDGASNTAYPVEVGFITGGYLSLWRDMKTYQNYAYMCADEGSEGLTVIDLSGLPNSVSVVTQQTTSFTRAHNIYIDEAAARLYVAGSNTHNSGIIVLDLSNPASPVEIGDANLSPAGYVHDIFVRGDTAYCSHGSDGLFIYDYTNADSPVYLGSITSYPEQGYNHSSWLTADGDYLVFADETKGKGLKIMDVTNFNSLSVPISNVFRSTLEAPAHTNSVAHNPFIRGNYVYISYYHDGIQVFDISNPSNVTNYAYFDTEPNNTDYSGFQGAWGAYPFLPSGKILGSDQLNGLFVLEVSSTPVPAELVSWYGTALNGYNELFWVTATETETDRFIIERSDDGEEFREIGQTPAAEFSNTQKSYAWKDASPYPGGTYYRLKTLDLDGSYEYSDVIFLQHHIPSGKILRVYPTVVASGEDIYVEHDLDQDQLGKVTMQLLDASGRVVSELSGNDFGLKMEVRLPSLPTGIYILQVQGVSDNFVQRITIQ